MRDQLSQSHYNAGYQAGCLKADAELKRWTNVIFKIIAAVTRTGGHAESEDQAAANIICQHIDGLYAENKRLKLLLTEAAQPMGLSAVDFKAWLSRAQAAIKKSP